MDTFIYPMNNMKKIYEGLINQGHCTKYYRICCAPGCRSNFTKDSDPIQTFPFPDDNILKKKWLLAIRADSNVKLIAPHICIKHFEDHFLIKQVELQNSDTETIVNSNGNIVLVENAIPTIFFSEQLITLPNKNEINTKKIDVQYTYSKIEKTQNFCRICLASNIRLIPLASVRNITGDVLEIENNFYGNMFENIFAIKTSDLPTWLKICFLCQNQLESFFKFQQKAQEVHDNLFKISKTSKLMEILSRNSEEKYIVSVNEISDEKLNNIDGDLIEDQWNDSDMNTNKCLSDNDNEKNSKDSQFLIINENDVEYLEPENYTEPKKKKIAYSIIMDTNMNKEDENGDKFDDKRLQPVAKSINSCEIKCDNCNNTFNNRNYLRLHKLNCNNFHNKYFKCKFCLQKFYKETSLKNHLKSHDDTQQNMHYSICNKNIHTNYSEQMMKKHKKSLINSTNSDDEELFQNENVTCQLCNIIYGTKQLLQQHLYHDHLMEYKFKCPYSTCCISFLNEVYLKNHIQDHVNPDKHSFLCDINNEIIESRNVLEKVNSNNLIENGHTITDFKDISTFSRKKNTIELDLADNGGNIIKYCTEAKEAEKNVEYLNENFVPDNRIANYDLICNDGSEEDNRKGKYDLICNDGSEEEYFFEIDIKPDFF